MENNCPIQVVINSDTLIDEEKKHGGGGHKDYYAGKDEQFREHKTSVARQLDLFATAQMENPYSQIAYAKVILEKKAIAKSNRPTDKLITEANECKVVGGGRKGEMLVRFSPSSAQKIKNAIGEAEDETTWVTNRKGKQEARPSTLRSEVGAIREVYTFSPNDRCPFTAEEVVTQFEEQGGGYLYVELFETADECNLFADEEEEVMKMFDSFETGLGNLAGVKAYSSKLHTARRYYVVHVTDSEGEVSCDEADYDRLLEFLATHPVVKRVTMAPVVQCLPCPSFKFDKTEEAVIPEPVEGGNYPLIGVADSGVAEVLDNWVVARVDNINPKYRDENHGTFIGGLYVTGHALNPSIVAERDGNRLVDICVLANDMGKAYPGGMEDFLINLRNSVKEAVETTGVRIIGLSMNIKMTRRDDEYSLFAKELDDIAETMDVIFVVSAGNLLKWHREWKPDDPGGNINEYSSRTDDIVYAPAESIRNVSVGALNPSSGSELACYSCIGKGLATATKPDLVHIGGFGHEKPDRGNGLYSIMPDATITSGCGTSYAAPMVAKTLAALDYQIEGDTPRETLMALAIHSGMLPEAFADKQFKPYLKDWIGFGLPADSETILTGNSNAITLVFHNAICKGQVLKFPFRWPQSLIKNRKCMGRVKLTVVCTPILDYDYDEEFVREEIQVSLVQVLQLDNRKDKRTPRLEPIYSTNIKPEDLVGLDEEELRESFYKWNPVKVYEKEYTRGVNLDAGTWRLEARYLDREDLPLNRNGLVFTMILTIEDPDGQAPVYNEMRQELQAAGIHISDIRTAVRVASRV